MKVKENRISKGIMQLKEDIVQMFRQQVCESINLSSEGINRYTVHTPFMFDDGDHLVIILKQDNGQWYLSDEGHTFMHVSYGVDMEKGVMTAAIDRVLKSYRIKNVKGELRSYIENGNYGNAFYGFVQGLIKITDISYLAKGTSLKDF
jgi:hypothetical protein